MQPAGLGVSREPHSLLGGGGRDWGWRRRQQLEAVVRVSERKDLGEMEMGPPRRGLSPDLPLGQAPSPEKEPSDDSGRTSGANAGRMESLGFGQLLWTPQTDRKTYLEPKRPRNAETILKRNESEDSH